MRIARLAAAACVSAVLALGVASVAEAHTDLESTDPADGAVVAVAPSQMVLTFGDEVNPTVASATVRVGDGEPAKAKTSVDGPLVTVALPTDPGGATGPVAWRVAYRVVAADGHPLTGAVTFTVKAPKVTASPSPSLATPSPTTTPLVSPTPSSPPAEQDGSSGSGKVIAGAAVGGLVAGVGFVLWSRRRG